jgi:predicted transposase YbfD/YdcC
MEVGKYETLQAALADVPDERKKRGRRHRWDLILTLIAAAVSNGAHTVRGISRWVKSHEAELVEQLRPLRGLPSEATIRRALVRMPVAPLEERVSVYMQEANRTCGAVQAVAAASGGLVGQAVDGKAVRGVRRYGKKLHLVSLVAHGSGVVLNQVAEADKRNEITAVPALLQGRDLSGTVITMDALLTQRSLCQQILDQNGHYLVVVKANQPALYEAIDVLFSGEPWTVQEKAQEYQSGHTCNKDHGRLESRTLETSTTLADYLDWPGAVQVLRRQSERTVLKTGKTSYKTTYAITSLAPGQAGASALATFWRGHWTIENQVHYVRDVSMHEDAGHLRSGQAPHALATFRNAALSLFRLHGWRCIPDAIQHYAASLDRTLRLIGACLPP